MRLWWSTLLLVVAVEASGAELSHLPRSEPTLVGEVPGYQIRIGPAVHIPVNFREVLPELCRTSSRRIVACTFFAAEKLECQCKLDGERWKIESWVEFVPVMYLHSAAKGAAEHEQSHVRDVTEMLESHLQKVASRQYSSEAACRRAAQSERSRFTARMNGFRMDSNRRLH